MQGFPIPFPIFAGTDNNGVPLNGGKLFAYIAGTNTPQDTFSDAALTTPNTNPVVLDAHGRAPVFLPAGTGFKFILQDSLGTVIWTEDGIEVPSVPVAVPATESTGVVKMFAGSAVSVPAGYLICDGSPVSRAGLAALFAVIGTVYGNGNGATTFNLPDFRGRFALGVAVAGTGNVLGQSGGVIDHVHSGPSHTHPVASHTHTIAHTHPVPHGGWTTALETPPLAGLLQAGGAGSGSEAAVTQATADNVTGAASAANSGGTPLNTDAAGTGNTGTANPPYQTVNYIIKT